jgi:hypothetical protein
MIMYQRGTESTGTIQSYSDTDFAPGEKVDLRIHL